jgi:hypothetical protein
LLFIYRLFCQLLANTAIAAHLRARRLPTAALSRTAEMAQFCARCGPAPPAAVASKSPSPEKAKTSKNDEKLTILQYLQKKAKTSNSYSFPVSKT